MNLNHNYLKIREEIPDQVELVAVSKTKPASYIRELYEAGLLDFGENKVQDLVAKYEELPKDIRWHMIGHLQSNKVKYIAPFVSLIHGVDSLKLLSVVNKEALKNSRIIDCLLQVHIATESSKFGLDSAELENILNSEELSSYKGVRIKGLMGMATYTDDNEVIRDEFQNLKRIFEHIKSSDFKTISDFSVLSMGMSGDYKLAIEEGSSMIRIGSLIFGPRNYP